MTLFGKKKPEVSDKDVSKILAEVDDILKNTPAQVPEENPQPRQTEQPRKIEQPKQYRQVTQVDERVDRPSFAPLFVKIDRYRQILNTLGYLKTAMIMIKNSFITLNELEKAREETFSLINEAIEKIDSKISGLDSELIRPAGFHDNSTPAEKMEKIEKSTSMDYQDAETVEATVADLKGQIDQLKAELERMA